MSKYLGDTQVRVCPFARQDGGEDVTIGNLDSQVFLTIPTEALVILDALAVGKTVTEAGACFEAMYGECPDIADFLESLESAGFVEPVGAGDHWEAAVAREAGGAAVAPGWARRLCHPAVVATWCAVVGAGIGVVVSGGATLPGPSVLVFRQHLAAVTVAMFALAMAGVAVHELAHLAAARAVGVPARIGIGHRLWIVVAETDMTGIWMAPKRSRYLAFLAGPLVDAASASVLVGVEWAQRRRLIPLTAFELQIVRACLLLYLLRLLWQCFFFVRTDFYFVIATAFNCKNLLVDTQDFLHNTMARVFRSWSSVDQSSVPTSEMRIIRGYSLVWVLGRFAAFFALFGVSLPVLWRYIVALVPTLLGHRTHYSLLDALVFTAATVALEGTGLVMWLRGLVQSLTERKFHAAQTA